MLPARLEFHHLRCFDAAVRHMHFRRAAEEVGMTQPALSRRIRNLEEILGYPLFERTTRHVRLLPQGEVFRDELPHMWRLLEEMLQRARDAAEGQSGILRIGIVGSPVRHFIHEPLMHFRKAYPECRVLLEEASSAAIVSRILEGDLECGFYLSSVREDRVAQCVVARDQLGVAIPRDHAMAKKRTVGFDDLRGEKVILFPPGRNPALHDAIVNAIPGLEPKRILEAESRQTALMMAAAGFGIAVVGESMRAMCPDAVRFVPIRDAPIGIDIVMGWLKGTSNLLSSFFATTGEQSP